VLLGVVAAWLTFAPAGFAADTNRPASLPRGVAPLPESPPANTARLNPADIAFERIAALEPSALKQTLEKAGWPRDAVLVLVQSEIQRRLDPPFVPQASELRQFEFWRTGPDAEALPDLDNPERAAELERRAKRVLETIESLFPATEELPTALTKWEEDRRWGSVPPAKRGEIAAILAGLDSAILTAAELPEEEGLIRMWQLRRDARKQIAARLTAGELADFDLRNSITADQMRNELDNFQPSREEFLAIFRLRHPLELDFPQQPDGLDTPVAAGRKEAVAEAERKIETALGRSRYEDYVLSCSRDGRALQILARRERVADAATVRRLVRQVQETRRQLATLGNVETEPGATKAAKLLQELSEKLCAALGETTAKRYLMEIDLAP
jgi:hypothetical protein